MAGKFVTISGLPSYEEQKIDFPSGVFGITLDAHLSSLNATFGFNETPHRFELEYVPETFSDTTLPTIGSGVQFTIGPDFLVQGRIVHADYNQSARGNIISISVEDIRRDLEDIYIDTFGVFGSTDSPTNNVVDVRYWYIKNFAETRAVGRNRVIKDLQQLQRHGASYRQIYDAVKYFEQTLGTINDVLSKIPDPEVIESQLPFDPDAYRWQFRTTPLLNMFTRVLGDISYDFYWDMQGKKINVINRKFSISIDQDNIPIAGDPAAVTNLRYGNDQAERATSVKLYGAKMQGVIGNVGRLKTLSGAYDIPSSGAVGNSLYDMGITPFANKGGRIQSSGFYDVPDNTPLFIPGWRNARVKYHGPDGSIRFDEPNDRELKAALKGVEYWALEKSLDNRITSATVDPGRGTTQNQIQVVSQSGLGLIDNRGQPGRSWVLEWFNRIRNFAQNHYGRTYVLHPETSLYDELDNFDIPEAGWSNIENLTNNGIFEDDYAIRDEFNLLSVFWDHDNNKLRAWASFPLTFRTNSQDVRFLSGPKWGADGKGIPGQWESWNEDQDTQFVPIEVRKWVRSENVFQEKFLEPIFNDEKGLMIKLPSTCWEEYDINSDTRLLNQPILRFFGDGFNSETQIDVITDPLVLGRAFEAISGVALPIETQRRYGFEWPSPWASGTGTSFEVVVRDDLAPWEFQPRGVKNSWQLMEEEARSALSSRVVNRDEVTFAEVSKLGLPIVGFDNFADQSQTAQGYGLVSHGVTNLNITKNLGWWQTKYSIKSHFPQFLRAKPVREKIEEDFDFVIRRLEEKLPPPSIASFNPPDTFIPDTPRERRMFQDTIRQSLKIPVTINAVFGRDVNDEFYTGVDDRGTLWPAAFRAGLSLDESSQLFINRQAKATDGFLQIGMRAIYNYEEQEDGSFVHYFVGGVTLSAGRVVELLESPRLVKNVFRANIRTIADTVIDIEGNSVTIDPFTVLNVPFLNQTSVDTTLEADDKIFMGSNGNNNTLQPGIDVAVAPNTDKLHLVNTSSPSNTGIGVVTSRPNITTGLGGAIQTVSAIGGQAISDGQVIGGQQFNVRFVGAELDQVAVGDPCITIQEKESGNNAGIRLFCFIVKPLFAPFSAAGPGPFLTQ